VDSLDKKILFSLQENAITPSVEIAKKAGTNPKTVINRIKKLQSLEIIRGFKPLLHSQKMGCRLNKILLAYHNLSPDKEEELKNFCMKNPNITEFTKLFGEWDAEITAETTSMEEFRNLYITIREMFQEIIQNSESFPVFMTHKKHFLPLEFFKV
jgi:DNA-binding Lrp family transcriptional regulator